MGLARSRYIFESRYRGVNGTEYYQWHCTDRPEVVRIPCDKFWEGAELRKEETIWRPGFHEYLTMFR